MVSDPIADMFTRIRNALTVGQAQVVMPSSKVKVAILQILEREGYVEGYSVSEDAKPQLTINLKYHGRRRERRPVISNIQRVSSPGRRVYRGKGDIPWVLSGMGIAIMSTPKGLMTDSEARRSGVGGEVIGYVW
jgi:small subunit ribosomal protein S8